MVMAWTKVELKWILGGKTGRRFGQIGWNKGRSMFREMDDSEIAMVLTKKQGQIWKNVFQG